MPALPYIYAVAAAVSVEESVKASKQQHAAASDAKDEQAMARNKQSAEDTQARRADIRQERIRRAQIMQQAANSGAAGSSGEGNSIANLSASIGANLSGISGGAQTTDQMNLMESSIAGHNSKAAQNLATGSTVKGLVDQAGAGYEAALKASARQKYLDEHGQDALIPEEYK